MTAAMLVLDPIFEANLPLTVFDWDDKVAENYGDIRHVLEAAGTPIGSMDMMIAAHARSIDATLATNNLKHFRRVKGLNIVNLVL